MMGKEPVTKPAMLPPNPPGPATTTAFPDDYIRDLGDQIASLTVKDRELLRSYIISEIIPEYSQQFFKGQLPE